MVVSGGFAPPPGILYGVRIYADGTVLRVDHERLRDLARLSASVVEGLTREIGRLPVGARLVDTDPDSPMCMDVPSTRYTALGTVAFAERAGCHDFELPGGEGRSLRHVLDGLEALPLN
jgi:hypothetical protein